MKYLYLLLFSIMLLSCSEEKSEAIETINGKITSYQWAEWTDRFKDGFSYQHSASINDTIPIIPFVRNVTISPDRSFKYGLSAQIIEGNGKIIKFDDRPLDHSCKFVPLNKGLHRILITNSINKKQTRLITIEIL